MASSLGDLLRESAKSLYKVKTHGLTLLAFLSKSKFLAGHQCPKRLWLEVHEPELASPPSQAQQRIFDQGHEVGELAQERFIGGVLIEADHLHIPDAIEDTRIALAKGEKVIYEGAFEYDDVLVRPDILLKQQDGIWHLVEVKSSTRVKPENIQDVTIQTYVLGGSGLKIDRTSLLHINPKCAYPLLENLFELANITPDVQSLLPQMSTRVRDFKAVIARQDAPEIQIGSHCGSPYDCPFRDHCWEWVPEHSIFNIPRLAWKKKTQLLEDGIIKAAELPEDYRLSGPQARYMESLREGKPVIDWEGIRKELAQLQYPLHFLDFETDAPAVPWFDGMHPYEQFPFQFFCVILNEEGEQVGGGEWLHLFQSDSRGVIAVGLLDTIGSVGSVVAYNANFEREVLKQIAKRYPAYADGLQSIIDRLWDQLVIFKQYYTDYRFNGSNSLKNVLPVIVPEMTYENLRIKDGTEAQVAWNSLIKIVMMDKDDDDFPYDYLLEEENLYCDLTDYCRQDVYGMVEIHRYLAARCQNLKDEEET